MSKIQHRASTTLPTLSIVSPVYNEEDAIEEFVKRVWQAIDVLKDRYAVDVTLVDDGSRDRSLEIMKSLVPDHDGLKVVELRGNSGQTAALQAGLDQADSDFVITMDSDLQHFPEEIPTFMDKIEEGWDVVCGWRHDRQEGMNRKLPSRAANWLLRKVSGLEIHDIGTTFRVYRGEVIRDVHLLGESHRFVPIYAKIAGARITELPIKNIERETGVSNYGLSRTFNVLFDLFFLYFFVNFRDRPIRVFGWLFLIFWTIGGLIAAILLVTWIATGVPVVREHSGWFMVSALLILFGVLSILSGITLEMIVRIYYRDPANGTYKLRRVWSNPPPADSQPD
ncbi:MAG: glycosyltransferase family 2 protein [Rhizobiaceae bacterium]